MTSAALELPLVLTDEERMLVEMVDQLVADRIAAQAPTWDAGAVIDPAISGVLEDLGLFDTAVLGQTPRLGVLIVERLARGSAAVAALVGGRHELGTLTDGSAPAGVSLVRGGWQPIRATEQRSGWTVDGAAPRVEGDAAHMIVLAGGDDGETLVLGVEAGADGVTEGPVQHGPGLRGVPTRAVGLSACPATHLGGPDAAAAIVRDHALTVAAIAVGVAAAAFEAATAYAAERRQFGSAISTFPAIQWLLDGMRTAIAVAASSLWYAVEAPESEPAMRAALLASQTARSVSLDAIQVHGGYGYIAEYSVERHLRDAISLRARAGGPDLRPAPSVQV
jgi:alkylation response protein AidB-like acyl-CoA dehydrogenase